MRNPHRMIYTSSYDRGLQHLLEMWPQVKEKIPDVELHVFYGWQLFDKFYKDNPASMAWKEKMVEGLSQPGITDHGRVSQPALIPELEQSGIWAYPTHFGEINCISALKAQACGCEPVVVNYAALKETVKYGRKVDGDIYDVETKTAYLNALVDALNNPMSDEKREEMKQWVKDHYRWNVIAEQWSKEFVK